MADSDDFAWDADDFDPDAGFAKPNGDKWVGEDENLVIPVEDQASAATGNGSSASSKPKKSKSERIEEKKAARRKGEDDDSATLTEMEEKLKRLMLQKQADLGHAQDLFGEATNTIPQTTEEFAELGKTLADQVSKFSGEAGYFTLLENLVRHATVSMDPEDCRRLAATLTAVAQEKNKLVKDKKGPAKKKGKKLNLSKGAKRDEFDLTGGGDGGGYDDDMDFM
ncbi:eukaryotic translation initiation factor 3 subunit J-like [Sycon ciliatum]|uniref:eukaryotic translation initiation factor 3 subunit J-like n=1 Tax=Sycon ciliatum TaxID=27933 RepID=UPI0020AC556D|eukprot:scpid85813/ scgid13292/ Eukaryotic translation initiation factor 3 subunit J